MDALSEKIISVTKRMRKAAYESGEKVDTFDVIPFGGSIRESIGPFPEFILKGRFCKRSERGMCSPCFYSRLPVHQESCEDIDSGYDYGYREQVKHISDHFQEKFLANQKGEVARDFVASKPVYAMVCTPTGSYFDNNEYPEDVRVDNLRTIVSMADEHGCEIVLHIESHAEDIIQYFNTLIRKNWRCLRSYIRGRLSVLKVIMSFHEMLFMLRICLSMYLKLP